MLAFDHHVGDGTADGPVVLLLHCWSHDRTMWKPQIAALTRRATEVVVPDLPGHGASPLPPRPFTFDDIVGPVVRLIDLLDRGPVVVAGLSLGAAVAVQIAVDHPGLVSGAVLADSALPDGPERARRAAERIRSTPWTHLLDAYEEVLFAPSHRAAADRSAIERWRRVASDIGPEALADLATALHARRDPRPKLGRVRVPTVIVHGALDAAVPSGRRSDYLAIPGSRRIELAGAGHLSNLDAPEEFTACLVGLLNDVASSGPI